MGSIWNLIYTCPEKGDKNKLASIEDCVHALIVKVKLVTVVEGDPKAPFSIATTQRCRGRRYSFTLDCSTLPLIRTIYCWVLSKEVSSTIFKVFGMTRPGLPDHWRTRLPTRPILKEYFISFFLSLSLSLSLSHTHITHREYNLCK